MDRCRETHLVVGSIGIGEVNPSAAAVQRCAVGRRRSVLNPELDN